MSLLCIMPLGSEAHEGITPRAVAFASSFEDVAFPDAPYPRGYEKENYWARFARMRNDALRTYLRPEHTDVLWVDSDLVRFPPDLYERLCEARPDPGDIIAPLVLIEGTQRNGDPAGCRSRRDDLSAESPPWFTDVGPLHAMASVGACVLVPADLHRAAPFVAQRDLEPTAQTEWLSIADAAHARGRGVWLDERIVVEHADLPRYGIGWHSGIAELIEWGVR